MFYRFLFFGFPILSLSFWGENRRPERISFTALSGKVKLIMNQRELSAFSLHE